MNVNVDYWGSIFGDRKTLLNPYTAFSTSKSYLIVGMLVQVILLILVLQRFLYLLVTYLIDLFLNLFMLSILHYNKVFQPYNK